MCKNDQKKLNEEFYKNLGRAYSKLESNGCKLEPSEIINSQHWLGTYYEKYKNNKQAIEWYIKAANNRDIDATIRLSVNLSCAHLLMLAAELEYKM